MKIFYHKTFLKHFGKRIAPNKKLQLRFYQRFNLLLKDSSNPILRKHQLKGEKKSYWSFSVSGDIRVIYRVKGNKIFLYDIGSHVQVY